MECPHCKVNIHENFTYKIIETMGLWEKHARKYIEWGTLIMECPACAKTIIKLLANDGYQRLHYYIYPKAATRPFAPPEVPTHLAEDFNEACLVINDSPKASAALSRRCLQALLSDQGHKQHDLAKAIDAVLATKTLPSHIAENVDGIRSVGNFAAHTQKDTATGNILPVEPDEADWNLNVLEELFDFYFVAPAKSAAKRAAFNAKAAQAGKPPIKAP